MEFLLKRLLFIFLLLTVLDLAGQQPALRQYSVDNGLPSSEVYHILQDSKGYMWLATNMGVSRFDGRHFKNFDTQDGLPENTVFEIYEDFKGRIWFISFPFQLSYYSKDSIYNYPYNHVLDKIASHGLIPVKKGFYIDQKENIYFSFLNSNQVFQISNMGFLNTYLNNNDHSMQIVQIDNKLIAAQNEGHHSKDLFTSIVLPDHKIISITNDSPKNRFGNYMIEKIKTGEIILALNNAILVIKNTSIKKYILKERILWMNIEESGYIWIGKEAGGVQKFKLSEIYNGPIETYLANQDISSVCTDKEGGIWFSTLSSGVYYLSSRAFKNFTITDGLSGNNIKSIEVFRNQIYVGSGDKVIDMMQNGKVQKNKLNSFSDKINLLKSFNNTTLWIGAKTALYSWSNEKLKKYENNHKSIYDPTLSRNFIFSLKDILPLNDSDAILAQMRSLSIISDGKIIYDSYYDDSISLRIEAIAKINDNSFLLGTFNGLWSFSNRKFKYLGKVHNLLGQRITDIVAIPGVKGYILGTKGSGLVVNINDSIYQINQSNGLSSNSVTSLLVNGNELWAATNNGLNLLSLRNLLNGYSSEIIVFKKEHGLISNEINQIKSYKQFIYIATTEGLTVFDRSKYNLTKIPPPVYIENVRILRRDTLLSDLYKLKYNQNFITISYGGINFRDAGNLRYKYRLVGLNQDWVKTRNLQVEYAFLPSGKYKFEVYAINSEGLISSKPAILNFIIYPPFWKTWWFLSLMAVFAILLTLAYISFRTRQIRLQHALQSDISKYKQQALIRQMDPHFVFNTLNSIQAFVMKNDSIASTVYLSKFSRLMRLILNNSQKQEVLLADEIDALSLYMELESMRFKHKFEYCIDCDADIETELINIPAFIVQPLVENAIWHGILKLDRQGSIKINFYKDGDHLLCTIEDNGIGRLKSQKLKSDQEKNKKSIGISIVETRLSLLSSYYGLKLKIKFEDLYSENKEPSGTKVILNLPIIK